LNYHAVVRVLHLVAADRWTGAAATALQAVEALHEAGIDVRLAYRPGRGLQERLAGQAWALPALRKERSLADIRAAVARVRALLEDCELAHVHLPHDHVLVRLAARALPATRAPLVRGVHHPGHLRRDPYHRWLFHGCAGAGLANSDMRRRCARVPALRFAPTAVMPVALERRFRPGGDRRAARARLGIPADAVVAGTIGKLDATRGQDLFLRAVATIPALRGLIIGKGPYEPALRRLAADLEIGERLTWAGYREEGTEHLYAAMDLFVFPAAGSDWAHRAIAEAAGCGLPTLAADLAGIRDLVVPGATGDLYPQPDAAALAVLMQRWTASPDRMREAGEAAARRAATEWTPARLAATLLDLYAEVLQGSSS
jgi:glycosyltransferase involved in cell wall biosynthesis